MGLRPLSLSGLAQGPTLIWTTKGQIIMHEVEELGLMEVDKIVGIDKLIKAGSERSPW